MAFTTRALGQPFTVPLGDTLGPSLDHEMYSGERYVVDTGEASSLTISGTGGSQTWNAADGFFDLSPAEIVAVVPASTTGQWYVWTTEDMTEGEDGNRLRALGRIKVNPAIDVAPPAAAWLLDGGTWDDAGTWDDTATWTEAA